MSELRRNSRPSPILLLAIITLWQFTASALAGPGDTTRVSVDSSGMEGNSESGWPSISADGRFVSFYSPASNLVIGDTNGTLDTFLYDRQTSTLERISVASGGGQGNNVSGISSISADGRFVVFFSYASNLVAGDTNNNPDIFVRDRQFGTTERVSVNSGGAQGNDVSVGTSISADGRFVAFYSYASNLVVGDTNGTADVFVRDRQTSTTERISVASGGGQGNFDSARPSITPDGRFVAFDSLAYNLVIGDTNSRTDVFVRDRQTNTTERVSVDSSGAEGDQETYQPQISNSISADGRFVAFYSYASNLVVGDNNGTYDVFVRDRQTNTTARVSVDSSGAEGNGQSVDPSLSLDGRFIAFMSGASNLVADDTNSANDTFVYDRQTGVTERISIDSNSVQGDGSSIVQEISADGGIIAFASFASNLVALDTNGATDVFVREREVDTSGSGIAGTTTTTDPEGDGATPGDPIETSVSVPVGGASGPIQIQETTTAGPPPVGYVFFGLQVSITAPTQSAAQPLVLVFMLDASAIPIGESASSVVVFRNTVPVPDCTASDSSATPDPCIFLRETLGGGDIQLTIRTSAASTWNFGLSEGLPPFSFSGFFSPVDNLPTLNKTKAASAVPVKFSLGGNFGMDIFAAGFPKSAVMTCDSTASIDGIEQTVSPGSVELTYDPLTDRYTYVWKTNKAWAGTCRQLVIGLSDGTFHRANFDFRK